MPSFEKVGRYGVIEKIGRGSFSAVYLCEDPADGRPVAVKVCTAEDKDLLERFAREAEIAGRLDHPNIVRVYESGISAEGPYLVQEYLDGEDLADKIRDHSPMSNLARVGVLLQIAQGLAYAHSEGVVHRDVTPSNIRVLPTGLVKIMDFGTARLAHSDVRSTKAGSILGTAGYLPPEQILGRPTDERADIFSFGALAYHLITNQPPFPGTSLKELLRDVLKVDPAPVSEHWPRCPKDLETLIACCLAKEPDKRYPTFEDVIADLVRVADELRYGDGQAAQFEGPSVPADQAVAGSETPEEPEGSAEQGTIPLDTGVNAPAARALRSVRQSSSSLAAAVAPVRGLRWMAAVAAVAFVLVGSWWLLGRRLDAKVLLADLAPLEDSGIQTGIELSATAGPLRTARLELLAAPWGEISRLVRIGAGDVDLPGQRITPLSVAVAPGSYRIEVTNPFTEELRVCYATVAGTDEYRCRVQFFDLEARQHFREAGWWR